MELDEDKQSEFENLKDQMVNFPCSTQYSVKEKKHYDTNVTPVYGPHIGRNKYTAVSSVILGSLWVNDTEQGYAISEKELLKMYGQKDNVNSLSTANRLNSAPKTNHCNNFHIKSGKLKITAQN